LAVSRAGLRDQFEIGLFEVLTGKEIRHWVPSKEYRGLAFSSNGRLLALSYAAAVHFWDVAAGKEVGQMVASGKMFSMCFAPGDKILATGSDDTTVLLWDISKIRPMARENAGLSPVEIEKLWASLAIIDAAQAYPALWA